MATLLIGLGGTGGEVLTRVKTALAGTPVTDVTFLQIDTKAGPVKGLHPQNEFVSAGQFNVAAAYREHKTHVDAWWYPEGHAEDFSMDGAGQTRLYGRLGLYLHGNAVKGKIRQGLRDLGDDLVRVVVTGSLAGGTGSSMIVDVGYLIKKTAQEAGINLASSFAFCLDHTIAAKFQSDDETGKAQALAAGLGALSELDFFMKHGPDGDKGATNGYSFTIHGANPQHDIYKDIQSAPYTGVFIAQQSTASALQLERIEHYYDLAAMAVQRVATLFSSIAPEPAGFPVENYFDTMSQNAGQTEDGRPRAYGSYGGVELFFPRDQISRYLQARFRNHVCSRLVVEPAAEELVQLQELGSKLLHSAGLLESDNLDLLNKQVEILMKDEDEASFPIDTDRGRKALAKDLVTAATDASSIVSSRIQSAERIMEKLGKDVGNPVAKRFLEMKQEFVKTLDKTCQEFVKAGQWTRARGLCEELTKLLIRERRDVLSNEGAFRDSTNWGEIESTLRRSEGEILRAASRGNWFSKKFKKQEIQAAIARPARSFAADWFDRAIPFISAKLFVDHAIDLYDTLVAEIDSIAEELGEAIRLLSEDARIAEAGIGDPLASRIDTVRNTPDDRALQVKIANFENLVDALLLPDVISDSSIDGLSAAAGKAAERAGDPAAAVLEIHQAAKDAATRALKDLDLTGALRLEAQYFLRSYDGGLLAKTVTSGRMHDLAGLKRRFDKVFDGPAFDEAMRPAITDKKIKRSTLDGLVVARLRELLQGADPFWNIIVEAGEAQPNRRGVRAWCERGHNSDLERLMTKARDLEITNVGHIDDPDRAYVIVFDMYQSLGNLTGLVADRHSDALRRTRTKEPRLAGCSDRRFLLESPYCDHQIFRPDDMAMLVFGVGEAMGVIVPTGGRRANFKIMTRLKRSSVRKGESLGASLEKCVNRLRQDGALVHELQDVLMSEFEKELVRNKRGLKASIDAMVVKYSGLALKSKPGSPNRNLYDELHRTLEQFAGKAF